MSPLYLYNGNLLLDNGALASNISCCCSGEPPTETAIPCADQCSDFVLLQLAGPIDQGPADMSANINALLGIGYTNVFVDTVLEDGIYTYTFNVTCCGQQGNAVEAIQGFLTPICICNE